MLTSTQVSSMVNRDGPEMLVTRDLLGELSKARCNNIKKDVLGAEHINYIDNIVNPQVSRGRDAAHLHHHHFKPGITSRRCHSSNTKKRCHSPDSPLSSSSPSTPINMNSHSSNLYPENSFSILAEESCSLELKLNPSTTSSAQYYTAASNSYASQASVVCTLDKVKSALERAEKSMELSASRRSRASPPLLSPPPPSIDIDKEAREEDHRGGGEGRVVSANNNKQGGVMFAAGCPGCLLYVVTSRADPKCPRCNYSISPCDDTTNGVPKKPRIDLNDVGFFPL